MGQVLSEILVFRRKELSYDFYFNFCLLIVRFAVSSTRNTRRNHGTRLVFCCCFCDVIVLDVTIIFKHLQEKLFQTNKVPNSQWFNTTFFCLFRVINKKCFVDSRVIGTLSNEDVYGGENIARKMNLFSFKLTRVNLDPLSMSNVGDFSWS